MPLVDIASQDIEPLQPKGKLIDISPEDIEYGKGMEPSLPKPSGEFAVPGPIMPAPEREQYGIGFATHPEFGLAKRTLEARKVKEKILAPKEEILKTEIIPELRTLKEPTEPKPIIQRSLQELVGLVPVGRRPIFGKGGLSKEEIIRNQNIVAIAEETNLPPSFVQQEYDSITKKIGLRGIPTHKELLQLVMAAGIGAGLITAPFATTLGVSTYLGVKEAESIATQVARGEKPKLLQGRELKEFLGPLDERQGLIIDTIEFMAPGLLGMKIRSAVKGKLTERLKNKWIDEAWDDYVEKQSKNLLEYKGKPPVEPSGVPPKEPIKPSPIVKAKIPEAPKPVIPERGKLVDIAKEDIELEQIRTVLTEPTEELVPTIIPKTVDVPTGWTTEVVPNFRRTPGWKSEVDWKNKRIVFETMEDAKNIDIINHEIGHIRIEESLRYIEKLSDSPLLESYAKIVKEPKDTHINFIREHLAMDYGEYLTNPDKVKPELKNLFDKYFPKEIISAPSPTRKGEQLLPGMKVGLEQPRAEAVMPTLEGTPLGEAARKAELDRVQPKLELEKPFDPYEATMRQREQDRAASERAARERIEAREVERVQPSLVELIKSGRKEITPEELKELPDVKSGAKTPEEMQAYLETKGIEVKEPFPEITDIEKMREELTGWQEALEKIEKEKRKGWSREASLLRRNIAYQKKRLAEVPEKTISQFTEEYKEGLGEGGFIKVGGVEVTPKVVTPGTKDVALPEFGLGTLHVADRHPSIAPILKGNIKAEQNTNHWILRHEERIAKAFDKVERPGIWMTVFGRRGTGIRELDLMIEGKTPVPTPLTEFVTEIKGILGDIKGEIIQKMKNDFAESLSPKQREYLNWEVGGRVGEEPKTTVAEYTYTNKKGQSITVPEHTRPVPKSTKLAVEEALKQFNEMEGWGIQDYFPHIFKGRYKYLTEDGGIIASGQTAKQAKANFMEYVESHPETTEQTFMFVNDFYDLLTVRKALNPELTNPLEYLGTRLSRKEFFRLLGRTEKVIKEEIANAGVDDIPRVKVDMSGIASFQKGTKFSGHFLKRKTSLRGEETDPFRALMSYVFSVGRKLGLEDAKRASYSFADSLPANMPNAKSYIKMQADLMSGRYNIVDRLFDETIGERLGMKPFGVTRITAKGVTLESKLKLGYAPAKTAINRMGGVFHIVLQEGAGNYLEGRKLLKAKDPELTGRIEREAHLAGIEQLFSTEGMLIGASQKQMQYWRPMGAYQKVESVKNRPEALAAAYVAGLKKFSGDKDAAWIYALDSAQLTQGLYNTAAKPVLVRGPVAQASYQFKQYLNNEIRFMSQLTPAQWAVYIPGMIALSGTRGALLTIKSIIGISVIGIGIDELMERLNRKAPHLHRGIFGLIGIDVSAPASWQIPTSVKDWIGVFPRDIWETGEMIIKGLKNNGWTDEQINDYVRQIAPVGYNVFKGLQLLSEGATKEGTKVIYRGGKEEGVINLGGAKSVSQSQASDSARYMNQQRQLFLEKSRVLEDRLFGAKSVEDVNNIFKELVELKNIQTPQEMQDFINGLRQSAKSRTLTEEARIFMTLPRALKKEEILRRR